MTTMNKLESKNGVELFEIVMKINEKETKTISYEIYMDGEYLSRYHNEKQARSMWRDFSGC